MAQLVLRQCSSPGVAPRLRGARLLLYAIKVLALLVMQKPATLKPSDREMVLVMERVHSSDLADEMALSHMCVCFFPCPWLGFLIA